MLDNTSLVITIIGAINWLLVGLFRFDLVAYISYSFPSLRMVTWLS